jgi:hypothetical protein
MYVRRFAAKAAAAAVKEWVPYRPTIPRNQPDHPVSIHRIQ